MLNPKYGERCRPVRKPSTTVRASSSKLLILPSTAGSRNCAPPVAVLVREDAKVGGPYIPEEGTGAASSNMSTN